MNKGELVGKLAEETGLPKKDAQKFTDAMVSVITNELASGGEVAIQGFGKFSVADRAARPGRNPKTGEKIQIPAKKAPKFSPGKEFETAVN